MPNFDQEKVLELFNLLLNENWALFEIGMQEVGLLSEGLEIKIRKFREQPNQIRRLNEKLADETLVSNNRKEQLKQKNTQLIIKRKSQIEQEIALIKEVLN